MLATLAAAPPTGDGNAIEWKIDGQTGDRRGRQRVTVFSRNGADVSRTFPELGGDRRRVGGRRVVLDGEIVALDTEGRPSFTRLQRRWPQQRRPRPELVREVPCRLMAFDILQIDGRTIVDPRTGSAANCSTTS